jgi:hypothetical protein
MKVFGVEKKTKSDHADTLFDMLALIGERK